MARDGLKKIPVSVGLDIGSTKVAVTIGREDGSLVNISGYGLAPAQGLRRGVVVSLDDTVSAITAALEDAERMSGVAVNHAVVSIGGQPISNLDSQGVIAVSRADGEISEEDVDRVIEASRAVNLPVNQEILHVIPKKFVLDGQEGITDPVGMNGVRLEVETHVISGASTLIKNLTKCVYQAGLEIDELVFSPLATAKVLLSKRQRELGVILIDLGAGSTNFAVFEDGDVLTSGVIPIGAEHITNDVAIGLRVSIDTAEIVKIKYGSAIPSKFSDNDNLDLSKIGRQDEGVASLKYVSEIIEARLHEIFLLVRDQLKIVGRDGRLPAGAIFAGGGSRIDGLVELGKEILHLPAQVGSPIVPLGGMIDRTDDPIYAASSGLMLWGLEEAKPKRIFSLPRLNLKAPGQIRIVERIQSFFKQFY